MAELYRTPNRAAYERTVKRGERAFVLFARRGISTLSFGRGTYDKDGAHLDCVYCTNWYASDGHAGKNVTGDLEEAHHEGAVKHVFRRFPDPPPSESRDARPPPAVRQSSVPGAVRIDRMVLLVVARGVPDPFPKREDEDAVARHKGELDKREGDGVPESREDRFAGVGREG